DWSHYPEHIGHKDWPGCFRCHDGHHLAEDSGASLPVAKHECNACHLIRAQGESVQAGLIDLTGLTFEHPDGLPDDLLCSDCHTGALQ
ncbi:MAG: cytochrome C, partial [Puniceicoccaceae bacterium]